MARWSGILLAAGSSSRLGQAKQLVSLQGESLVRRTARRLLACRPRELIVVVGAHSGEVAREISDLPLRLVHHPDWQQGMGSSLACGVNELSVETDGALIALCDQWQLERADFETLLNAWNTDISDIYMSEWLSKKSLNSGPPAIFPRKHFPELVSLNDDHGARVVAMRHAATIRRIRLQNAASDLDQPADLDRLNDESEQT